jgi:hypothetical protein
MHDPFAKMALAVYALQCKDKYPALYDDLVRIVFDENYGSWPAHEH